MRRLLENSFLYVAVLFLVACPANKEGVVTGRILPSGAGIRVAALDRGRSIVQVEANPLDGQFRLTLPAGAYDIRVTTPTSPFPLSIAGVVVKHGETTALAPMFLAESEGTGTITGKVVGAATGARVTLFAEGVERSSVNTDAEGKYEFERLPAGKYTVQVNSPGYAKDALPVNVSDTQRVSLDFRLLYITIIEGIDWNAGKIRSRGIGVPPKQEMAPAVRREMAKRAALADAERNMIRSLEIIKTAPDQNLTSVLGDGSMTRKLSGFLQGYRIAAERDMDGGKIEVEIELPLTGPGGLASHIQP